MRRMLFLLLTLVSVPMAFAQHSSCSVSVAAVQLGSYAGARVAGGVTPVSVICPAGMAYTISLRSSAAGSGNTVRALNGSHGQRLSYQLFQDAAHTSNWGSEIGTDAVAGVGTGAEQRFNIYPVLMQGQRAAQGEYSDTMTVTVTSNRGAYSTTVPVHANAISACILFFATGSLTFGNYAASVVTATTTLSVNCTADGTFNIGLNAGTTAGATTSARKMAGPSGATLNYQLFRDSSRTLNWGNAIGTDTYSAAAAGLLQTVTIYGQIPAGQVPTIGSYSDTITATITY